MYYLKTIIYIYLTRYIKYNYHLSTMHANIDNFNYLKDTVCKFKNELQRMMSNPSYPASNVHQLKQTIDEIEKNIQHHEKLLVSNYLKHKNSNQPQYKPTHPTLPNIKPKSGKHTYTCEDEVYTTLRYVKQSTLDKMNNPIRKEYNEEKRQYISNMQQRRIKHTHNIYQRELRNAKFMHNKNTNKLLSKYNINSNIYDHIKVTVPRPNFMDTEKRLKYSVLGRRFNNNEILYDKNNQPIIRKEELDKGLLNMIYKGLIPKGADLSPALSNGNPLQINMKTEDNKVNHKEEELIDKNINFGQVKVELANDEFFITKGIEEQQNKKQVHYNFDYKDVINENVVQHDTQEEDGTTNVVKKKVIMFGNYSAVKNAEYKEFYNDNQDKWGAISYLFQHLSKFLKKRNLTLVEVLQEKILELAEDEMKVIEDNDLLECINTQTK